MVCRLLSKCTKHEEDCTNFCVLLRKSDLYRTAVICDFVFYCLDGQFRFFLKIISYLHKKLAQCRLQIGRFQAQYTLKTIAVMTHTNSNTAARKSSNFLVFCYCYLLLRNFFWLLYLNLFSS
jgi:hypothetical protein